MAFIYQLVEDRNSEDEDYHSVELFFRSRSTTVKDTSSSFNLVHGREGNGKENWNADAGVNHYRSALPGHFLVARRRSPMVTLEIDSQLERES